MKRATTMRTLRNVALVTLMAISVGCFQREVREIVATSHLDMLTPYLQNPREEPGAGWKDTIARIDGLIESKPEEKVLVNHLRVRQAMLLTVNQKDKLAQLRWKTVEKEHLKSARDLTLLALHETLVWAYVSLRDAGAIDESTRNQHVRFLDDALQGDLETPFKIYLHTIRAQIELKYTDNLDEEDEADRVELAAVLANGLKTYVNEFSDDEAEWVRANGLRTNFDDEMLLQDFRHRVWLRAMIRAYRDQARNREVDPAWIPSWVGAMPLPGYGDTRQ